MVLLTFSALYEKLMNRTKTQTIRRNKELWDERYERPNRRFDLWWGNPRNMWRNPDIYKMGLGNWTEYVPTVGDKFDLRIAVLDGFNTLEELLCKLSEKNDMSNQDVLAWEWPIIRWDWTKGPLPMPVRKIA